MRLTRREFLACAGGLGAVLLGRSARAMPPVDTARYALAGAIFTGKSTSLLHGHAVLIDNGRIEGIVPDNAIADWELLIFPYATILPGIINCHVHRIHTKAARKKRYLDHGVTGIGDAASPLDALAQLTDSPPGTTTDAACTGPMLCPPGGYPLPVHSPEHALVATSPNHGRECVRRLADAGATMVKFALEPGPYTEPWPLFDPSTAGAICDEARRLNMITRCHVEDVGGLSTALDAGVHTVEHVPHRWIRHGTPHPVLQTETMRPIAPYRALLDRMVAEGVILTPTLDVLTRSIWNGPELFAPVRYFATRGGQVAVGNDHPYRRTEAGMPLREMRLLRKAGLDNHAILSAATRGSAAACSFTDRGSLVSGNAADLLVVNGDPLTSPATLGAPLHIIKDGFFIK